MNISEISAAEPAPRNAQAKSSHKRTVTVIATFALATAFALAGTPDAAAASAATNNHACPFSADEPGGRSGCPRGTNNGNSDCRPPTVARGGCQPGINPGWGGGLETYPG